MFSTLLGSHGTDQGNGIALDNVDNVYITGDTNSDQFPVTGDAVQTRRFGGFDAVVAVLNPTGGQLLYSTFLGGTVDDFGYAIALDGNADIYLTGITSSSDFPTTQGAPQPQPGGGSSDAFVAKIGFGGSSTFSTGNAVQPAIHRSLVPGRFVSGEARPRSQKLAVSPFDGKPGRHR